ncbi:MAG: cadherin domain-containing protein [Planctomycetes bacterium]|nr:cadherin domain-containing protein [Planctomycetota bacterium]
MYFNFQKMVTRLFRKGLFRRSRKRRPQQPSLNLAFETLEVRALLSSVLVSDVLSGTASTTIVGTVYEDANSNGVKDKGENGIPGWNVFLDLDNSGTRNADAAGTMEPLATTNVDGDFIINHLKPGTYRLAEELQAGWVATSPLSQDVVVKADKDNKAADFLAFSGGDIAGTVWNDVNADGVRATDPGTGTFTEPGLVNWTLFIDLNRNQTQDATDPVTVTDENGNYAFRNLPPRDYKVYEVLPNGWDVSPGKAFDNKQTVTVNARKTSIQDFANYSLVNGSIQGTIWNDLNADGIRAVDPDTGAYTEPGLENWTVFLDLNVDGVFDAGEPSTLTDADGHYSFVSVPEGTYEVTEILPDGWSPSSTFDIQQSAEVVAGSETIAQDFANFTVLNGSISGTVWNDLNRDGERNTDVTGAYTEPGLANWEVFLDLNRNKIADAGEPTVLTDTAGGYLFPDLQVGDYEVQELLPSGWETTVGFDNAQTVTVYSGTESVAGDFANFNITTAVLGSVSGTVWHDLNGNGVRDVDSLTGAFTDLGLAGWVVFDDANFNGVLDAAEPSATTVAEGSYTIAGVVPGTVNIIEIVPAGWQATSPTSASHALALKNGENAGGLDFGNYARQEGVINGTVFDDVDPNGFRGAGERGLAGLTVYLDMNGNNTLDAGEPQTTTSSDQFFTPTVDETGTYTFTHLAAGTYTVRYVLPAELSATPSAERAHAVTLATGEVRSGVDSAAQFRASEIHGVRFDDSNGNHQQDAGEAGISGATVYVDLNRNNSFDVGEPETVTAVDGSYSFTNLTAGAYVVRSLLEAGVAPTYPQTNGGTLWPTGVSNPAVGNVTPTSITTSLAAGAAFRTSVSLTLPNTGALTNLVDVFLLFDDTGSFVNNSPIVRAAFPDIITQLQSSLPGTDLGFGVGRFEEYANFAYEYSTGRPFVLNQPIVAASTTGYMTAIQAALDRTTPGYGGDQPETDIEALYQLVTGVGFDGNNNGSVLDSGAAGLASTQLNPGDSGDVPSFASFQADASNSVMAAAGNVGGGGFRAGALPVILLATDTGFAYQPQGETAVTGVGGISLPVLSLTETSRPTTPFNYGAGLQQTVTALNSLGALVIGLGTNPESTLDPRQGLEALSTLTGAVNRSTATIDNGTADPIAPNDPLYFQIASGFASSVSSGVVHAIQNAATNVAVNVTVQASDPRVKIINHTGTQAGVGSGQTATFDIEFVGDGVPHRFDLQFVRAGTNVVLGSIPVVIGTPIPGDGYEFEDLAEGEIHHSVDFGSQAVTSGTNLAPTDTLLSASSIPENQPVGTVVGTLTTVDPNAGDAFKYMIVAGDTGAFQIVGDQLQTSAVFNFESQSSYSITVRSTDAGGLTYDKLLTISVSDVNETPTALDLSFHTIAENQPAGTVIGTLTSTDPDAGDNWTYSLVAGDVASFSLNGDQLQSAAAFDFETQSSYNVTVRTTDAGGLSFDQSFTINVLNLGGLPPVMTLPVLPVKFTENAAALVVNSTAIVSDPDTPNYNHGSLTVAFQAGVQNDDRLAIRHQGTAAGQIGIAGTDVTYAGVVIGSVAGGFVDNSDLVISLNANATSTAVAALVRNITFRNVGDNPTAATRTLRFVIADGTGELSAPMLRDVTVVPVNDLPILLMVPGSIAYTENDPAVIIDGTITITDVDSPNFDLGTLKVSFASGAVSTDRLLITDQGTAAGQIGLSSNSVLYSGTVIGSYVGGFTTSAGLTVTLNANATPEAVQALARQIAFVNVGDNPTATPRVVRFTVADGDGGTSLAATRTVAVTAVNDNPVITTTLTTTSYVENAVAKAIDSGIKLGDPDSPNFDLGVLTVQLASGGDVNDRLRILDGGTAVGKIGLSGADVTYGGVVIGSYSGGFTDNSPLVVSLNANATLAAVGALMKAVSFQTLGDTPVAGTRVVEFTITDGDGGVSLAASKNVLVSAVNDVPVATASAGATSYTENDPVVIIDNAITVSDVDSPNFDLGTLKVTFASVTVSTDRLSIVDQGTGAGQIGLSSNSVLFGGTVIGTYVGGFTTSAGLTITLNANATPEAVQALARQIAFVNVGDNPTATLRVVRFVVTDGDGGTSLATTKSIVVTPVNDAPVLANIGATAVYTEGKAAVVVAGTITAIDPDSLDFDGGALTVSLPAGATAFDLLEIRNVGTAAGQIGFVGTDVTYGGVTIGTYSGGTSGTDLVVSFNNKATLAAVQAVARNITFRVVGPISANSTRTIRFSLTDGDGGTSVAAEKTINVVNVP